MNSTDLAQRTANVVLIEDDPNSLEFMHDILELWGYQVGNYHDPADALQALLLNPEVPDLIVSDLRFSGGMDGFELIESLRAVHPQSRIPALLITGDTDPAHSKTAAANHIRLLYKPLRPSNLQSVLNEVCRSDKK